MIYHNCGPTGKIVWPSKNNRKCLFFKLSIEKIYIYFMIVWNVASIQRNWLQKGGVHLVVEFHRWGPATNRATFSSYQTRAKPGAAVPTLLLINWSTQGDVPKSLNPPKKNCKNYMLVNTPQSKGIKMLA